MQIFLRMEQVGIRIIMPVLGKAMQPLTESITLFAFFVELKDLFEDQPYKFIEQHKQKYPADFSGKRKPKTVASVN